MRGSGDAFRVAGLMTLAEVIAVTARIHSIYLTGGENFVQATPWYQVYVDYALENGILAAEYPDYNKEATRAEFAAIAAKALPEDALTAINSVEDGRIPDVSRYDSFADAVYTLYRAGVLTGDERSGAFFPYSTIDRSSAAAILTRLADSSLRKIITLEDSTETESLTEEEILRKCSSAIFLIENFDSKERSLQKGIGVFLSGSGLAVTDPGFLGGYSAKITLPDSGKKYDVLGIYQQEDHMTVFQVDGSGFSWMGLGTYTGLQKGDTVYLIGNKNGKTNTIGKQRLTLFCKYPAKTKDGESTEKTQLPTRVKKEDLFTDTYFDGAPVTFEPLAKRSSDFAVLVDESGKLIGIRQASHSELTPSYSVWPYKHDLQRLETYRPIITYHIKEHSVLIAYPESTYIPDFGAYFNLEPLEQLKDEQDVTYYYSIQSMGGSPQYYWYQSNYFSLLEEWNYHCSKLRNVGEDTIRTYENTTDQEAPAFIFSITKRNGYDCVAITIPPA